MAAADVQAARPARTAPPVPRRQPAELPEGRRRLVINAAGGTYTALVVMLFAVVKFTEGAWLIVIIFPVLVHTLIRLNRQYRKEAAILEDLGDDLHPSALRAVHFSLDSAQADKLRQPWPAAGLTMALELADCPDRRLGHAAAELAAAEAAAPGTHVTVVLPRRSYPPLTGRLLHDHTADRLDRRTDRRLLRPYADRRPGARTPGPAARHGRHRRRRPPRHDQPGVRPARVATLPP
jgi:hypothetical protein